MAIAIHEVPTEDQSTGRPAWQVVDTYKDGSVVHIRHESNIKDNTDITVFNHKGRIGQFEIPGLDAEADDRNTEVRDILFEIESDSATLYVPRRGFTAEDVTQKRLGEDTIDRVVYNAAQVQRLAVFPLGTAVTVTSVNGHVQTDAVKVL